MGLFTPTDRYELIRLLGSGGFGAVWLGRDHALDDLVAIKVLSADKASQPDMRSRFLREARLLRRVRSDRVVTMHDIGELADGTPYFVMAYADGGTLQQRMGDGAMPVAAAVHIATEAALGVAELHRRDVVHRDIKPSNILFSGAGAEPERVLISDLGLAVDTDCSQPSLIGGTPAYMAPEQARGAGANPASDVYALGALTYRLLTGRLPGRNPAPVRAVAPTVPPAVHRAVTRALAANPKNRPRTAIDFAAELMSGAVAPNTLATTVRPAARRRPAVRELLVATALVALAPTLTGDGAPSLSTVDGEPRALAPVSTSTRTSTASGRSVPGAGGMIAMADPAVRITRFTGAAATTGWTSKERRSALVRVPPRSMAVVTSTVYQDSDAQARCAVTGPGACVELAEVTGPAGKLWVHTWFNASDTQVYVTVKSTFTVEDDDETVTGQEVEVLSGVADPAVAAPRATAFADAAAPNHTTRTATAGSRVMTHFIATEAAQAPAQLAGNSLTSESPASTVFLSGQRLALGVIFQATNTTTVGQTTVGATTPARSTGVIVEYPPAES